MCNYLFRDNPLNDSIEILRMLEPPDGYYLAFSGGKDSIVLYDVAKKAGVKFDAHYNVTTADPPELIQFIRGHYPDVVFEKPEITMWRLIEDKGFPPTRLMRYCCEVLKERGGQGRVVLTGVRWAESPRRRERSLVVHKCTRSGTQTVNPIIKWSDEEVWEYINSTGLPYCSLYDEGFKRLGCVACPMAGRKRMLKELDRWPKFKGAYLRAFARMLERKKEAGQTTTRKGDKCTWETPEDVMEWWLGNE